MGYYKIDKEMPISLWVQVISLWVLSNQQGSIIFLCFLSKPTRKYEFPLFFARRDVAYIKTKSKQYTQLLHKGP